tara:strand:+ start:51 stop:257 length:207 start_codon:yes stop_codon:yes gene_type:complete
MLEEKRKKKKKERPRSACRFYNINTETQHLRVSILSKNTHIGGSPTTTPSATGSTTLYPLATQCLINQ